MQYPKLIGTPNNTYKLVDDYTIAGVTIPAKDFETDGLTLKLRVLKLVVDKYAPKFSPFFVLHDYLCSLDRYKEADELGQKVLFKIEYSKRTRVGIWLIKKYHKFKYGVKYGR